jgi:Ca-activated chloride channel family protein
LLIIWYLFKNRKQSPAVTFSGASAFQNIKPTLKQRLRHFPFILRLIGISLLIIGLARPQTASTRESIKTEGIDIVIAMDISGSMLAEDFKPNRLEAAKNNAIEFIERRINDRIGLIVFAGESFTQCPVTIDHDVLKNLITEVKTGMLKDGTAIGSGLATSVSRLKESKAKSKVVVLLTDGVNNTGQIAPRTAADIAYSFGIKVYTIGVGTKGKAPYPVQTPFGTQYRNVDVEIDEPVLEDIAEITGGRYFRATDNESLESIYSEIDDLEKTEIDVSYFSKYTEEFLPLALAALLILFIEILLRYTWLRVVE